MDSHNQKKVEKLTVKDVIKTITEKLNSKAFMEFLAKTKFPNNPFTDDDKEFEIVPAILSETSWNYDFKEKQIVYHTTILKGDLRYKIKNDSSHQNHSMGPYEIEGVISGAVYSWEFDSDGEPSVIRLEDIVISSMKIRGHEVPIEE